MQLEIIELEEANCFSSTFLKYINQDSSLKSFYNRFPSVKNFKHQIEEKSFPLDRREVLVEVLSQQYKNLEISDAVKRNIDELSKENTYTIVTGHQLNILTGPLYFIYKIVTAINSAKKLKQEYPDYNFVPVYWMASEDHDFEEISYFRLEGKKYTWQTDQQGAVGRFNPKELKSILDQLPGQNELFEKAYLEHDTLADAVRYYVNELFGEEGLVVVDADNHQLKRLFIPVIEADVLENSTSEKVDQTNKELELQGISTQINARDINFFYLDEGIRSRIVKEEDRYKVLDTYISFSAEEIKSLIQQQPEKFSPNVVLRPLYQETILPNLAYIGGPAEVVYWLQLKGVFDYHSTPFPMIMPRNFGMVINQNMNRLIGKLNLDSLRNIFLSQHELEEMVLHDQTVADLSYSEQLKQLQSVYSEIQNKAQKVDPTLVEHIEALKVKAENLVGKAEKKLIRAEKRNHEISINRVGRIKEELFPNNGLQERTDNFLNFYHVNPNFISELLNQFDPFNYRFNILIEK